MTLPSHCAAVGGIQGFRDPFLPLSRSSPPPPPLLGFDIIPPEGHTLLLVAVPHHQPRLSFELRPHGADGLFGQMG